MDESSATDDSEDDNEDKEDDEGEQGMAGSLVDIIKPAILNKIDEPIEIQDSPENKSENSEVKEEEEDSEVEEELAQVIAKQKKDLSKKQKVDLNVGSNKTKQEPADNQKIMELLELEMRARAIKSLLSKTKKEGGGGSEPRVKTPEEPLRPLNAGKAEDEEEEKVPLIKDPEEARRELEEAKKLHKAREALSISTAKKRQKEEEIENQKREIQRRIEEQEAKKRAEMEAERLKREAQEEKIRKKREKEEEREKFLQWKAEKILREAESQRRQDEETETRARENLKRKISEMALKEAEMQAEKQKLNEETELKKRKIQRENVDVDELDRDFEITFDYEEEDEIDERNEVDENKKPRRYRRKNVEEDEDGEIVDQVSVTDEESLSVSGDEAQVEKLRQKRMEREQNNIIEDDAKEDVHVQSSPGDLEHVKDVSNDEELENPEEEASQEETQDNPVADESNDPDKSLTASEDIKMEESPQQEATDLEDLSQGSSSQDSVQNPSSVGKSFSKRNKNWQRKTKSISPEPEPDYVFKTKRQVFHEQELSSVQPEADPILEPDPEEDENLKKERERKQKQMEMRLKRMQAFQARSIMTEETSEEAEPEVEEEAQGDFYKSYFEEEEKLKKIAEQEEKTTAEKEEPEESEPEVKRPVYVDITNEEIKAPRDPEVAEKEGVAYWTKVCEKSGDFQEKPLEIPQKKVVSKDLPSKEQVDAQQAEQETWQERWYATRKVQKVVKDAKIYSKVRSNIKKLKPNTEPEGRLEHPGTSAKDMKAEALRRKAANKNPTNLELPAIVGSSSEYVKLTEGKADPESADAAESDESEEEDEGDGLWSAIMGKK